MDGDTPVDGSVDIMSLETPGDDAALDAELNDIINADDTDADTVVDAPEPEPEELFEIVVDGQVEKLTKDEIKKLASHGKAAAKRMQEASKLKSDAEKLLQLAQQDPIALLKHLNPDLNEREILTKRMAELLEEELMSPEEKSQREQLRELEVLRAEAKARKEAEERAELEKMAQEQQVILDKEIGDALREANVPKNPAAVKRLAQYMYDAAEAGLEIPTAKLAMQVRKDIEQEIKDLLSVSDDTVFEQLLGSELLTKAQKLSVKQLKAKQPGQVVPPSQTKKTDKPDTGVVKKSKEDIIKELGLGDTLF